MPASLTPFRRALAASFCLHGAALAWWLPSAPPPAAPPAPPLEIRLQAQAATAAPQPQPVMRARATPQASPAPRRTIPLLAPAAPNTPAAAITPAPSEPLLAASPPSALAMPTPPPPQEAVPNTRASGDFQREISAVLERNKRYPRIAQLRGWQGKVILQLEIAGDGSLREFHVAQGSGVDVLDREALKMLQEALPLPAAPLRMAGMSIQIPVVFRLE